MTADLLVVDCAGLLRFARCLAPLTDLTFADKADWTDLGGQESRVRGSLCLDGRFFLQQHSDRPALLRM